MELSTGITTFSHILNVKDKLFPREKSTSVSEDVQSTNRQERCSVYIEHAFDPTALGNVDKEIVEVIFSKKSDFTVPIRHIDWVLLERKLDAIKPRNIDVPKLLLIEKNGLLMEMGIDEIMRAQLEYMELKGRELKKALDTLAVQVTYADGIKDIIRVPNSLRESIYNMYRSD